MRAEPVTREEIARKEKTETLAIKAAMARRMTGKMNDAQSSPIGKFRIGNERLLDESGPVPKREPPGRLHEAA